VLTGQETLEVVGESFYQNHLWKVVGGFRRERVRYGVQAVLDPEPQNPHDSNAVRILIDGGVVGHLSREDAAAYLPGLHALMQTRESPIALEGCVVGGGQRSDRTGMLGVFLDHDPDAFGVRPHQVTHIGELRTGLSQAIATDLEDDSYDLSWLNQLSGTYAASDIPILRLLLETEADPIDRHFMLGALSKSLYRSRDVSLSALEEFDAVCLRHHDEMDEIRPALVTKFGAVPLIDTYRQAAIRCQRAKDWSGARAWAERGLAVYGAEGARPEAIIDLQKRLAHAEAKMTGASPFPRAPRPVATPSSPAGVPLVLEILTCSECGQDFGRPRTRGRKPHRCPACRSTQ
jgi:hypothetical protein